MTIASRVRAAWSALTKTAPSVGGGMSAGWSTGGYALPNPSRHQLIQQYRELVFACATINADAVATATLRLFATTSRGQRAPKCACRPVSAVQRNWLNQNPGLSSRLAKAQDVNEVLEHPALDALDAGNEFLDGFATRELTQLYQEIEGNAFWFLERGPLGTPRIWVLPSFLVTTLRDIKGLPIGYRYGVGTQAPYTLDEIIPFRMPCLSDPYGEGYSPLKAVWESSQLSADNTAYTRSAIEDRGWLNTLVTPTEPIGQEEADRMRAKIKKMMRLGKLGGPMVSEAPFKIEQLETQIEAIAIYGFSKETMANAFGVPMAMLTKDTNLANAVAARQLHALLAVLPRCRRMEAKLNQRFTPLFDERLFLAYDNPVPDDVKNATTRRVNDLKMGVVTINEERAKDGLAPVEWGDKPWTPVKQAAGGTGKPEEAAQPPKNDKKPKDEGKIYHALAAHACGEISYPEALKLVGNKAWLALPSLPPERMLHHEACAAITDKDWYLQKDAQPHQRHLPTSPGLEAFFQDVFKRQRRDVLDQVGAKVYRKDLWRGSVDLSGWLEYMAHGARPFVQTEYLAGLTESLTRLGASENLEVWSVTNPKVRDAITAWTMRFCEATNQTTTLAIEEALAQLKEALVNQLLSSDNLMAALVQRVNAIFEQAEKFRARRIAVTEASRALHLGQRMGALESGVVIGFRWLASADACEACKTIMNENPTVDLTKAFAHLDDGPYGTILCPPAHPFCMCTMTEILGETDGA